MFWPFRRQMLRPTLRPRVRLCLESLEGRDLPSVSMIPFTAPSSGAAALSNVSSAQPVLPSATHGNTNGAAGEIPALFNGQSVTINVKQLPDNAAASILANNKNIQLIFVTNDLDEKQDFAPVLSAIPGQGFNALWQQILYSFNSGFMPHQFTSEADILAAAKAGEITLNPTDEVYRDSVVGGGSAAALSKGSSAPSSGAAALSNVSSAQPALPSAAHGNTNGAAGEIPALFNGQSVTINVKQLSDTAAASIIAHNKSLNIIYVTNDLDEKQDFTPVINAVPGQGFNALWLQVQIIFNPGVTPHQFTSEADILAAAQAGQITLVNTGEVYRDSVVGGQSG